MTEQGLTPQLRAYGRRCAVTGEEVPELLEAGHLEPYVDRRSDHLQNGICLRVDLHRLFDAGLIAVDESGQLLVSSMLGKTSYAGLAGTTVRQPEASRAQPSPAALERHRAMVFRP